ncbi:hypothetical protein HZ326_23356 [Fusarium oxysporum f. sp. albedinis]|nr:Transcription factor atf21 [Fusarium oxysporum f. sp. albedinis]KAJ0133588.1 hypothetical protein HZ326_23356 [Fusarium oxysporum f. sp. albedinis]
MVLQSTIPDVKLSCRVWYRSGWARLRFSLLHLTKLLRSLVDRYLASIQYTSTGRESMAMMKFSYEGYHGT